MPTTTSSTSAARILTEILANEVLAAPAPVAVASQLVNEYSISGEPSKNLKLSRYSDLGPAGEGTEGTDFSTITTLGYDSNVTVTPVESAIAAARITDDEIANAMPAMVSPAEMLQRLNGEQIAQVLSPYAARLGLMLREKLESDVIDLFTGLSQSVGTTTQAFTMSQFEDAIYTLTIGEPEHFDFACCLAPIQWSNLRKEVFLTGGGFDGPLQRSEPGQNGNTLNGYVNRLLNVDIYQMSQSVVNTANSGDDVEGSMFLRGIGNPEQSGQGQPGAFAVVHGDRPYFEAQRMAPVARSTELVANHKYKEAERVDAWGVKIVTDAG